MHQPVNCQRGLCLSEPVLIQKRNAKPRRSDIDCMNHCPSGEAPGENDKPFRSRLIECSDIACIGECPSYSAHRQYNLTLVGSCDISKLSCTCGLTIRRRLPRLTNSMTFLHPQPCKLGR